MTFDNKGTAALHARGRACPVASAEAARHARTRVRAPFKAPEVAAHALAFAAAVLLLLACLLAAAGLGPSKATLAAAMRSLMIGTGEALMSA